MVHNGEANAGVVFLAGGYCDFPGGNTDLIAKYDVEKDKWSRAGFLQEKRWSHRAILNGNKMFISGGDNNMLVSRKKTPLIRTSTRNHKITILE